MKQRRLVSAVALAISLALGLSACGGGGEESGGGSAGSTTATPKYNAAVENVFNPSDAKGVRSASPTTVTGTLSTPPTRTTRFRGTSSGSMGGR
jgi:hypothetical protein